QCEFRKMFLGIDQATNTMPDLARVAAEFLAEANRSGVLKMRPANLEHCGEVSGFFIQSVVQFPQSWYQSIDDAIQGRHVDGRRDDIVAGLTEVDMIIRVN